MAGKIYKFLLRSPTTTAFSKYSLPGEIYIGGSTSISEGLKPKGMTGEVALD